MKKIIILLLFVAGLSGQVSAQSVKPFECEPYLGFTLPQKSFGEHLNVGLDFGVEARYNLDRLPLSIGLNLNVRNAVREDESLKNSSSSWTDYTSSLRTISATAIADWNFRQGKKVAPFVSIGAGVGDHNVIQHGSWQHDYQEGIGFIVVPRVGVELWNHLRITLDAQVSKKYYSTFGLRLGYAFGGGLRSDI